ncbi:hypothetical protein A2U01_0052180, partial [Trifolium medium]|nr:hypothetical protein [Trifolium medium]
MQFKWRELNVPSSVAGVPFPVDKPNSRGLCPFQIVA